MSNNQITLRREENIMKKNLKLSIPLFVAILCMMLCSCEKKPSVDELLQGSWTYKDKVQVGDYNVNMRFKFDNGNVTSCAVYNGQEAEVASGTYTIEEGKIILDYGSDKEKGILVYTIEDGKLILDDNPNLIKDSDTSSDE